MAKEAVAMEAVAMVTVASTTRASAKQMSRAGGHARGVADTAWQEGMLRWISSSPIGLHGLGDVGKSRRAPTSTRPLSPFSSYSSGHLKTAT